MAAGRCSEQSWQGDVCVLPAGHPNYHASAEGIVWALPNGALLVRVNVAMTPDDTPERVAEGSV